ncbi:MAG: SIS domain-containing protein [Clostridia bacterium]|nr:SIS domain-containing protein [Clostridia bacterium]
MKKRTETILEELTARYPNLRETKNDIISAFEVLRDTYSRGGIILACGNGGSSADADHITGELLKAFKLKRPLDSRIKSSLELMGMSASDSEKLQGSVPAISFGSNAAALTAAGNDLSYDLAFAQQMLGFASDKNCLIGISTSGNSKNVLNAGIVAKSFGVKTVALTGKAGGKMKDFFDVCICVPESDTAAIQELHLPVYHALCAMLESEVFDI